MECVASLIRNAEHLYLFSIKFLPIIRQNALRPHTCIPIFCNFSLKFILLNNLENVCILPTNIMEFLLQNHTCQLCRESHKKIQF
jgi:hypothetical protein